MSKDKPQSDQEIVSLVLIDKQAFSAVVERYQAPLRRYISRLGCTDPHDIRDVLQEVFIKCYTNLNDYDPTLKFSSWLYRIAHNETVGLFRKKRVRPTPVVSADDLIIFEQLPDGQHFLEDLMKIQDGKEIRGALAVLQEKYREPLMLRFFEEKSYTEISDILEIPEGTVATYINRGKTELKGILSPKRTI